MRRALLRSVRERLCAWLVLSDAARRCKADAHCSKTARGGEEIAWPTHAALGNAELERRAGELAEGDFVLSVFRFTVLSFLS